MNKLYVGLSNEVELPANGFLFIDDEIPNIPDWKRPKIFDPLKHGFNPLKDIDYRKAREIADVLYTVYSLDSTLLYNSLFKSHIFSLLYRR